MEFIPEVNQVLLNGNKPFTFDHVFDDTISQEEVYSAAVQPLVESVFKGYHATVLAYGQTGSGKTYSMGSACQSLGDLENCNTGIIPRVISDLFDEINSKDRSAQHFIVKVSYLEVYKEELLDLLCPQDSRKPINIRETPEGVTFLSGLTERTVLNATDTIHAMVSGNLHRTTGATAMNLESSRSHAIFTIILECTNQADSNSMVCSKFHLVDLAGSERAKRTKAVGERFQEGVKINRGLLALGNVISALADENSRNGHIKYRDSKLTRILQSSLGGNSHTLMIACISPADSNLEETLNTLRYADRVRKIKNKPVVNHDPHAIEVKALREEIQSLRVKLLESQTGSTPNGFSTGGQDTKFMQVLREENIKLTEQIQSSVDAHAEMCEKAILVEIAKEKLHEQMSELITSAKAIENDSSDLGCYSEKIEDESVKGIYSKLILLRNSVLNFDLCETIQLQDDGSNENVKEEDKEENMETNNEQIETDKMIYSENQTEDSFTTAHTLKKADLGKQLQELSKALTMKQELAKKVFSNDCHMAAMREQYEMKIRILDDEIQDLVKKKSNLETALENAQKTSENKKISDKRQQRLIDLEAQIQELKKEKKEKQKMIRMKQESDRTVTKLNNDILEMKRTRVRLMRQIKEESDKFTAWKKEKVKEVKQLQERNRKRNFQYVKLERDYGKQKAVLRRKTEEAAAANRRLKLAMGNRQAASKRMLNEKSESKLKAWLGEEIEILSSIKEVEHHLHVLLDDRKSVTEQLQSVESSPSKRRRTFTWDSGNEDRKHMIQEIELKNAQIKELQSKLVDAKEHRNSGSRWSTITSLVTAKQALKCLMDMIVKSKVEGNHTKIELVNIKVEREAAETLAKTLQEQIREMIQKHEAVKNLIEQKHSEDVGFLMKSMVQIEQPATPKEAEVIKHQADEIQNLNDLLETTRNEKIELEKKFIHGPTSATLVHNKTYFSPISKKVTAYDPVASEGSESDEFSDYDSESDYLPTPERRRRTKMSMPYVCSCRKTCSEFYRKLFYFKSYLRDYNYLWM